MQVTEGVRPSGCRMLAASVGAPTFGIDTDRVDPDQPPLMSQEAELAPSIVSARARRGWTRSGTQTSHPITEFRTPTHALEPSKKRGGFVARTRDHPESALKVLESVPGGHGDRSISRLGSVANVDLARDGSQGPALAMARLAEH